MIDPVTLAILNGRLEQIADEMDHEESDQEQAGHRHQHLPSHRQTKKNPQSTHGQNPSPCRTKIIGPYGQFGLVKIH